MQFDPDSYETPIPGSRGSGGQFDPDSYETPQNGVFTMGTYPWYFGHFRVVFRGSQEGPGWPGWGDMPRNGVIAPASLP